MGVSQAVSGMNAAARQLDVIGNNIANSSTAGFKSASISFADMYAGSKVGMGVRVAAVMQNFSDGTPTSTNNPLDVAISGKGFFRLVDSSGQVFYTRNGQFQLDKERNIVSVDGYNLTGYLATGNPPRIDQSGTPGALRIPEDMLSATASTKGSVQINLNSNSEKPKKAPVNPSDSESYNYSTSMTAYDSLGNEHNIRFFYVKGDNNEWKVHYIDSSDANMTKPKEARTMTFDSSGKLTSNPELTIDFNGLKGATNGSFKLSLANSTQQNLGKEAGSVKNPVIDGYKAGNLIGFSINDDGTINGIYSNQQTKLLGQIVMADFANLNGLEPAGGNNWRASNNSGQEALGLAGTGTFGALTPSAIETSNVDVSQELVNMIVAQRNYQSNSQSIKTHDQILNTLVNLR